MIQNLKYTEIDFAKYNNCLHNSINYKIFAEKWYLDVVTNMPWNCLVLDDYKAIMPITFRKKFGLKYVAQPLFTQQLGVFYVEEISKEIFNEFFKKLNRYWVRSYCFNHHNTIDFELELANHKNYELQISENENIIFKNFSKGTKAEIKVAVREGVYLEKCENIQQIAILNETYCKYKITPIFRQTFTNLLEKLKDKNQLLIYISKNKNATLGFICMIVNEKTIQYLFSCISPEGKKLGVSHFQIFEVIKKFSNEKNTFDFLGSELPGVAKFFRSFNPELKNFTFYKNIPFI